MVKYAKPSFRNKVFIAFALIEGSAKSFRLKSELEREFPAAGICLKLPSTEYTECQAFSPVVLIVYPLPLTRKRVLLPPPFRSGGGGEERGEGGGGSHFG
jgi:hypothetical protein